MRRPRQLILALASAAVLGAISLAACGAGGLDTPAAPKPDAQDLPISSPAVYIDTGVYNSYVWRWEDPTYKVVCWESKAGYSGGISCLPVDQLAKR